MRVRTGLLCIVMLSSCLPAEESKEEVHPSPSISAAAATVIDYAPDPLPEQLHPERWDARTSSVTWPGDATRLQVVIRRGHAATATTPATFYAFIVSDGNRLRRALLVPTSEYSSFVVHLTRVFTTAETPASELSYSIAGGLYVGPRPVGPPGGPLPRTYLDHLLSAASAIDQSVLAAVEYSLEGPPNE
jgi:hypothetical protein